MNSPGFKIGPPKHTSVKKPHEMGNRSNEVVKYPFTKFQLSRTENPVLDDFLDSKYQIVMRRAQSEEVVDAVSDVSLF